MEVDNVLGLKIKSNSISQEEFSAMKSIPLLELDRPDSEVSDPAAGQSLKNGARSLQNLRPAIESVLPDPEGGQSSFQNLRQDFPDFGPKSRSQIPQHTSNTNAGEELYDSMSATTMSKFSLDIPNGTDPSPDQVVCDQALPSGSQEVDQDTISDVTNKNDSLTNNTNGEEQQYDDSMSTTGTTSDYSLYIPDLVVLKHKRPAKLKIKWDNSSFKIYEMPDEHVETVTLNRVKEFLLDKPSFPKEKCFEFFVKIIDEDGDVVFKECTSSGTEYLPNINGKITIECHTIL